MSTLTKNLTKIHISEESLSKRELDTLTKIQELYDVYVKTNDNLKKQIQDNKFNKNLISDKGICSRQTLYKNEVIANYVELLLKQADDISEVNDLKYVAREKYNEIKEENSKLVVAAVKNTIIKTEIERLTLENKRLRDQTAKLNQLLENEKKKNSNKDPKPIYN